MATYTHVTQYILPLQSVTPDKAGDLVYNKFVHACHEPDITDHDYFHTLEGYGIAGGKLWHANVESLDMPATIALLTFVLRADHMSEGSLLRSFESGYLMRILLRLAELDGTWVRPNVVTFYHEYEKDGYMSNWFGSPFTFGSDRFPTSEHWMMWQKACVFGSWDIAEQILSLPAFEQGKVKWLGKNKVAGFDPNIWDAVNLQLMRVGLRQKFVQNERLMNDLLSTGSAALAEAAPKDTTWGVGIGKGDPKLDDPANWHGKNLLGTTLMEVRSELRQMASQGGYPEWSEKDLFRSQLWQMNLLELARIPSTRPVALMYAQIVYQSNPSMFYSSRAVLRNVRNRLCDIDDMMNTNMGGGLPIAGWRELKDELAVQVKLGRI